MSHAVPQDVVAAAAEWIGLLDSADASDADWLACEVWCAANPSHRMTFDRMRSFHDRLGNADPVHAHALKVLSAKKRSSRGSTAIYGLGIATMIGLPLMFWQTDAVRDHFPDHQTKRGELKTVPLTGGSSVKLDTATSVRISEHSDRDHVRLLSGRIFANVRSKPDHRFIVETGFGSATALGTAYEVALSAKAMTVSVAESKVRVCPAAPRTACQTLTTGQRARVTRDQVIRLRSTDPARVATWSSGWIDALNRDLVPLLDELNRYRPAPVAFDRGALQGRTVSGVFPITDPDAALRGVAASSGTRIVHTDNETTTLRP